MSRTARQQRQYEAAQVWTLYTIKDREKKIVGHVTAINPDRTKAWKTLRDKTSEFDKVGYCLNELYHTILPM